jgi:hypothetical protein
MVAKSRENRHRRSEWRKLILEPLEDRRLLATVSVTTFADNNDSEIVSDPTYNISWLAFNKGPDGQVSLREAIIAANNTSGLDTINFAIPTSGGGDEGGGIGVGIGVGGGGGGSATWSIIMVGSSGLGALPVLTSPVIINGYSQSGASANTSTTSSNATILIGLDGTSAGLSASGLTLGSGSSGSSIRGLGIQKFGTSGVFVGSSSNTIAGNFIGLTNAGTVSSPNGVGISLIGGSSNTIGGVSAADRNLVSGNTGAGISLQISSNSNVVLGNFIGLSASGLVSIGNSVGISIENSSFNTIGGTILASQNTISSNLNEGITIAGPSIGNAIQGNAIYGNAKLGIDLIAPNDPPSGVTPNDDLLTSGNPIL